MTKKYFVLTYRTTKKRVSNCMLTGKKVRLAPLESDRYLITYVFINKKIATKSRRDI